MLFISVSMSGSDRTTGIILSIVLIAGNAAALWALHVKAKKQKLQKQNIPEQKEQTTVVFSEQTPFSPGFENKSAAEVPEPPKEQEKPEQVPVKQVRVEKPAVKAKESEPVRISPDAEKEAAAAAPDNDIADEAFKEVQQQTEQKKNNDHYSMVYLDSAGEITKRDIDLQGFLKNQFNFYIFAYCYLRKTVRQFTVANIQELWQDGKRIPDPVAHFSAIYEKSDQYKTLKLIDAHFDEVMAMIFLARSDSVMRKNERETILRFLYSFQPDLNAGAAEEIIKKTYCDLAVFQHIMKGAGKWPEEKKRNFYIFARQIYDLKGTPDPAEQTAWKSILESLDYKQ